MTAWAVFAALVVVIHGAAWRMSGGPRRPARLRWLAVTCVGGFIVVGLSAGLSGSSNEILVATAYALLASVAGLFATAMLVQTARMRDARRTRSEAVGVQMAREPGPLRLTLQLSAWIIVWFVGMLAMFSATDPDPEPGVDSKLSILFPVFIWGIALVVHYHYVRKQRVGIRSDQVQYAITGVGGTLGPNLLRDPWAVIALHWAPGRRLRCFGAGVAATTVIALSLWFLWAGALPAHQFPDPDLRRMLGLVPTGLVVLAGVYLWAFLADASGNLRTGPSSPQVASDR